MSACHQPSGTRIESEYSWPQIAECSEDGDHDSEVEQTFRQRLCDTHPDQARKPHAKGETQPVTRKGSDHEIISQHMESTQEMTSPRGSSGSGGAWPGMENGNPLYYQAVTGVTHGRPAENRHRLQPMSCVTFMVSQPVGSVESVNTHTLHPNKAPHPFGITASKQAYTRTFKMF